MDLIQPSALLENAILEVRGDGKAGGGLVLVMQSLAGLFIQDPEIHVQEWPFFSSARKGAAIRTFLRVSRKPISITSEVTEPHISILMDEGASHFVDFAEGVPKGGTFVMNTKHTPEQVAKHYRLSGKVYTIDGDGLGMKYLKLPMGNISVFATMIKALNLPPEKAENSLAGILKKRRLPDPIIKANVDLFRASLEEVKVGDYEIPRGSDQRKQFGGYGELPIGGQTGLRISRGNHTANYARSGSRVTFQDPNKDCTGCSACIVNCPENIIIHEPDTKKGLLVVGAEFNAYCKSCRECVESCPQELFVEKPFEEKWEEI